MTGVAYTLAGLILMAADGARLPFSLPLFGRYDPMVPWLICAAFFRPRGEGLAAALVLGLAADSLSCGPFGLYLVTYVWLVIAAWALPRRFNVVNPLVWGLASAAGVLAQGLLACALAFMEAGAGLDVGRNLQELLAGTGAAAASGWIIVLGAREFASRLEARIAGSAAIGGGAAAKRME